MTSSAGALKAGAGLGPCLARDAGDAGWQARCWKWRTIRCAASRRWAARRAPARPAQIVAVTGMRGQDLDQGNAARGASASGETHASAASFNNHWGVPLTLARMPRSAAFGVFEIGMNHAGEITPLVAMVRPQVAIVTTIAASHLGNFASLDEIADAKAEIFTGRRAQAVMPSSAATRPTSSALPAPPGQRVVLASSPSARTWMPTCGWSVSALLPDCCCVTASTCMGETGQLQAGPCRASTWR